MCENVVQPGSPQMAIWRICIACWIPKATHIHTIGLCNGEVNFTHETQLWYKSYCSTVDFLRITSIYQPKNAHIISHKTLLNTLKYFDIFRSCQTIIRELCSLLKLYYSIHNSIRICKRGVVAAYHVVLWSSG